MSWKNLKSLLTAFRNELTFGDKLLIGAILVVGFLSLYVVNQLKNPGAILRIEVEGKTTHVLELNQSQTIEVTGPIGRTSVEIKHGNARVNYSDCPEKICVNTGKIHRAGDLIVCVPNKVVVAIENPKKSNFDVITQ